MLSAPWELAPNSRLSIVNAHHIWYFCIKLLRYCYSCFCITLRNQNKLCLYKGIEKLSLTHWGQVMHIYVSKLTIISLNNGLLPGWCDYLNQCWNIVNLNLRNKFQWNLRLNSYIFIQENAFENGVCKMAAILSGSLCVKCTMTSSAQMMANAHLLYVYP